MLWTEFYATLARHALRVDIISNDVIYASYLRGDHVPGAILAPELDYAPDIYRVPLLECRIISGFDLDKMFFNCIDVACHEDKMNPAKTHVIMGLEPSVPHYFAAMADRLHQRALVPSRIFVSDDIAREIVYSVNHNLRPYEEVKLLDDPDDRLIGRWRFCSIYRASGIPDHVMYMTTFADFLGVIPVQTDSKGPTDIGMAIFQPYGIAKAIL